MMEMTVTHRILFIYPVSSSSLVSAATDPASITRFRITGAVNDAGQ
jgi:hypothetical protein